MRLPRRIAIVNIWLDKYDFFLAHGLTKAMVGRARPFSQPTLGHIRPRFAPKLTSMLIDISLSKRDKQCRLDANCAGDNVVSLKRHRRRVATGTSGFDPLNREALDMGPFPQSWSPLPYSEIPAYFHAMLPLPCPSA